MRAPRVVFYFFRSCCHCASRYTRSQKTSPQTTAKATPIGRWRTVDDASGHAKSIVVIWEEKGRVFGRIEKLFDQDPHDPDPRCARRCADSFGFSLIGRTQYWLPED